MSEVSSSLNMYLLKLKVVAAIIFTLMTFIGIIFIKTFDYGNEFAKQTTDYSIKCLKEQNQSVKEKCQSYLSYIKNTIKDIKIIPILLISVLSILLLIAIPFGVYYLYMVMTG